MIKAIIFDLDGVLVDTKQIHFEALNGSPPFRGLEKAKPPPVFSKTIDEKVSVFVALVSSTA